MKLKQNLAIRYARAQLNILSLVSTRKAAIKAFRLFCTPQQRASGKYPSIFEKGERLSFRLEGHTVRGHRWLPGPDRAGKSSPSGARGGGQSASSGAPLKKVLIAHGFESSSRTFDGYIAALLKKGYEVIAFDAPGHGRSGGRRILLIDYVKLFRIAGQNYGPFDSFLGHSLGGLALALYLEETLHDVATRLVLIAPAVETDSALEAFAGILHLPAAVCREIDEYVQEITGHPFAWYSLRRALWQIRADILYFQDEEDRITPLKGAQSVQRDGHPNIRFIFTRGLGHRKIYKDPEILDQVVGFL
jgi:pimeloyl-ACP methyl ester carboxylesterase